MFVLSLLNGKPMVAGRNTAADGIITLAGGVNAIDAYEGYKQIADEAVIAAGPDTVLVMQRQQDNARRRRRCSRTRPSSMTPAAAQQILRRDGRALSARLRPAHRDARRAISRRTLYPALGREALPSERRRPAAATDDGRGAGRGVLGRMRCARPCSCSALLVVLALAAAIAAAVGAAGIPLSRLPAALGIAQGDPATVARDQLVLWSIRLPRIALAIMVGALLAAGGTVMQGLFRNPLADPVLAGISPGAGFASALAIVVGDRMLAASRTHRCRSRSCRSRRSRARWSPRSSSIASRRAPAAPRSRRCCSPASRSARWPMPASASWCSSPTTGNCATSRSGCSARSAAPPGARSAAIAPFVALLLAGLPFIARGLDLIVLGEAEAFHMGVAVERLKRIAIVLVAAATGAAVSVAGVIGFVGIVVPHLLRLVIGPGHRLLLPAALCLGAILLLVADTFARVIAAPAELPIGIVTAAIGAPFFLSLLLRQRALVG